MTYEEAIAFIHGTYKFGSKLGLENIKTLLEGLGSPQDDLKFIHVAGTNGKGSTSAFLHSILIESGYKTGLYTSPFIETFNERMRVDHELITSHELAELTQMVKEKVELMVEKGHQHPTEFEVVTAIAMLYFKKHACDLVVLEVGLGGRLDATNVIKTPLVSVVTPIDFDHTEYLGNTLREIATEKAGIIKEGGITVSYPQAMEAMSVISQKCSEYANKLVTADFEALKIKDISFGTLNFEYKKNQYEIGLFAPYQAENAALAIEVVNQLKEVYHYSVSHDQIKMGLKKAKWIGRMEIVSEVPFMIIDGAHNLHGIRGLAKSLEALGEDYKIVGIIGILKDKDVEGMLEIISPYLDAVIVTKPDNPRALSASELSAHFKTATVLGHFESIKDAVNFAVIRSKKDEVKTLYLAFGSLYMIGEVRQTIKQIM
ncbi:MAG TPA: bifunctional folylpolyglutamate synthase/dihydrofolate synthase [Clostridiales bacterium UBA8960]|nr:bifunctional folylpolyglutamate synthase/dihydrofolate synthase [Clostridiales bacterium UBA8960]